MDLFAAATSRGWRKLAVHGGDCPVVQRYMASRGRILRARVQRILDRPLGEASAQGREAIPVLIPRRHNQAAHNAAFAAADRAGRAAAANDITATVTLEPPHVPSPRPPENSL